MLTKQIDLVIGNDCFSLFRKYSGSVFCRSFHFHFVVLRSIMLNNIATYGWGGVGC